MPSGRSRPSTFGAGGFFLVFKISFSEFGCVFFPLFLSLCGEVCCDGRKFGRSNFQALRSENPATLVGFCKYNCGVPMIWHILTEPYILILLFRCPKWLYTLPIELVPSGNQTWQWTIHHDDWSLLSFFDSIDDLNGDLARSLRLTSFRNSALRISASSVLEKASAELCPQAQLAETIRFRAPKLHQMGISSNFLSHGPQVTMGWMIILGTSMT